MIDALVKTLSGEYGSFGTVAFMAVVGGIAVTVLWRALQKERLRSQDLVDKMLAMSSETATIIERITGRGKR